MTVSKFENMSLSSSKLLGKSYLLALLCIMLMVINRTMKKATLWYALTMHTTFYCIEGCAP